MATVNKSSTHILHIIGGMNRGGPETWLMRIMRQIDRSQLQMDFLVHTEEAGAYDQEVRDLGGKMIKCLGYSRPWIYGRNFRRILKEHGPYDVAHSHVQYYSGYVLRLAYQAGIPVRIAHNHTPSYGNIDALHQVKQGFWRRSYVALMKKWIDRYATAGLVVNREGGADMFGPYWETDPRYRILYYGIDPAPFHTPIDPHEIRAELGIPPGTFVVGNVARFFKKKNHPFVLEIAAELFKRDPSMRLLLVGDGPELPAIEKQVELLGLKESVIFAGSRPDVPRLMRGAMDVFLFPSLSEGLPNVLLEAQAAGLNCIISDVIAEEVDAVQPLMRRLSLKQPVSDWAEAVLAAKETQRTLSQPEALAVLEKGPFNICVGIKELEGIYLQKTNF